MIRKTSILLFILVITAVFVSAQETVCRCSEGEPCSTMTAPNEVKETVSGRSISEIKEAVSGAQRRNENVSENTDFISGDDYGTEISEAEIEDSEYVALVPEGIRNNEFYLRSLQLSEQAKRAFNNGFYDGSTALAEEALHYAGLSDRYVADQLVKEAKRLVDLADANSMEKRNPEAYSEGKAYYESSVEAQANREWHNAIVAAIKSIEALGGFGGSGILPSQYTVRSWSDHKDCLWIIAGYSFIYGDPWKWRELYDANRSRLPQPNNPNVIEPGFVLDIPSIRGETRRGMWDPNANYNQ